MDTTVMIQYYRQFLLAEIFPVVLWGRLISYEIAQYICTINSDSANRRAFFHISKSKFINKCHPLATFHRIPHSWNSMNKHHLAYIFPIEAIKLNWLKIKIAGNALSRTQAHLLPLNLIHT